MRKNLDIRERYDPRENGRACYELAIEEMAKSAGAA